MTFVFHKTGPSLLLHKRFSFNQTIIDHKAIGNRTLQRIPILKLKSMDHCFWRGIVQRANITRHLHAHSRWTISHQSAIIIMNTTNLQSRDEKDNSRSTTRIRHANTPTVIRFNVTPTRQIKDPKNQPKSSVKSHSPLPI